jgi:hypothetical protein
MSQRFCFTIVVLSVVTVALGTRPRAATSRFSALAVNMTGQNTGASSRLDIEVDRWSSDADRDRLAIVGDSDGATAVVELLQRGQRLGFVRTAGQVGNDITFARDAPGPDGSHRVLIVLARSVSAGEINRSSITQDYPFTVIELRVPATGAGVGTMTVGAKVRFRRGSDQVDTEKYSGGTIELREVKGSPRS